ncbi:MAG: copper amine oxidase N-terminal domain-containing protein [Candidatus Eremiobacteraeota bacterium]|nr:copper amine oxidase N-terminal domain-containing protein [Candidatus Eremiobacteraeota bacterium]
MATSGTQVVAMGGMMDFGSPPSGEVPILFNDHHVYAKPDTLRQGRVLAALVRGGTLLVPLRSMFEQMGATVTFDAGSKSVTASKPGSQVRVTLGKNQVIINGESRPLDVPPMMYKGVLLVPIRVISEALGAYVQWVPEQHVAVVRYQPPTPVPAPSPTEAATPVPTPSATPTPAPAAPHYLGFIQGGFTRGRIYNEFAAGVNSRNASYVAAGAYLFDPLAVKVDFRQDEYNTTVNAADTLGNPFTVFNTIDGGVAAAPQFKARQSTIDGRLELKIADPHIYIGAAYLQASTNYGYPQLRGVGGGLEKLPDFTGGLSWFGSAFYYPNLRGDYTVPTGPAAGVSFRQEYRVVKYDIGLAYDFGSSPLYIYGGYSGDRFTTKQNAPVNQTHSGPYLGLGIKF